MDNDNWQHRSKGMRCGSCMFFVKKQSIEPKPVDDRMIQPPALGRCRRHAPTMSGWPAVFDADWCGDHKLDENKI